MSTITFQAQLDCLDFNEKNRFELRLYALKIT